jgi:predicted nucleic acid-binding protein
MADAPFITCEAVLTEACFLTARNGQVPVRVIELLDSGVAQIGFDLEVEFTAIQALMQRYANVPMSFADACLVRMAEATALPICTLDSDFTIYRAGRGRALDMIAPPAPRNLHEP